MDRIRNHFSRMSLRSRSRSPTRSQGARTDAGTYEMYREEDTVRAADDDRGYGGGGEGEEDGLDVAREHGAQEQLQGDQPDYVSLADSEGFDRVRENLRNEITYLPAMVERIRLNRHRSLDDLAKIAPQNITFVERKVQAQHKVAYLKQRLSGAKPREVEEICNALVKANRELEDIVQRERDRLRSPRSPSAAGWVQPRPTAPPFESVVAAVEPAEEGPGAHDRGPGQTGRPLPDTPRTALSLASGAGRAAAAATATPPTTTPTALTAPGGDGTGPEPSKDGTRTEPTEATGAVPKRNPAAPPPLMLMLKTPNAESADPHGEGTDGSADGTYHRYPKTVGEAMSKFKEVVRLLPTFEGRQDERGDNEIVSYINQIRLLRATYPGWPEKVVVDLLGMKFAGRSDLVSLWVEKKQQTNTIAELIQTLQDRYGDRTPLPTRKANLRRAKMLPEEIAAGNYKQAFTRIENQVTLCNPEKTLKQVREETLEIMLDIIEPAKVRQAVWQQAQFETTPELLMQVAETTFAFAKDEALRATQAPDEPRFVGAVTRQQQRQERGGGQHQGHDRRQNRDQTRGGGRNGPFQQVYQASSQHQQPRRGSGFQGSRGHRATFRGRGGFRMNMQDGGTYDCSPCGCHHEDTFYCWSSRPRRCNRCGKFGHIARQCSWPSPARRGGYGGRGNRGGRGGYTRSYQAKN